MDATSNLYCSPFTQCPIHGGISIRFPRFRHACLSTPFFPISLTPFSLRTLNFSSRDRVLNQFVSSCQLSSSLYPTTPDQFAVLLEVDRVLIDPYLSGNRLAFNVAFQKLGLDCAKWTDPVYSDLLRKGDGNEERMIALYFDRIGWPTSLPTIEKGTFMKSVLQEKRKSLVDILMSKDTTLRSGVEKFIDDACNEGIHVVILTAAGAIGEDTSRGIVEKLGLGRISKLNVIGKKEIENSFYGQLVRGLGKSSGPDDELANEVLKAAAAEKKRIAEEVASMLKLRVNINTSIAESVKEIVSALRGAAEIADVPVSNCVLVAGSQLSVSAAEIIGMPCIFLRSRLTSRAEFPSTVTVVDGFGKAGLTVPKLLSKLKNSHGR